MKRFWFLAIALLLIWLDVFLLTDRKYPDYQVDDNYGRKTQAFVMDEVVGEYLPVDVVSDIPGLLILIVLVLIGGPAVVPYRVEQGEKRQKYIREGKATVLGERRHRSDLIAIVFTLCSIAAIVVMRLCPFFFNGALSYGTEYLVHLADIFLPLVAVFFVMAEWIRRTEIRTTHRETDVSGLTMMVSLFSGFFARFADLYGFAFIHYTAWVFEGLLMVIALVLHYISLRENGRKLFDPTPEPEPSEEEEEWNFPFPFPFR